MSTETAADPREEKLPKWAREEFANLRRRTREAESRAHEALLASGPADSDVIIDNFDERPILLGKGTRITFLLAPDRHGHRTSVTAHVTEHSCGPYVELLGSDDLAVSPASSNKVGVSAVRVHRA